jgi:hypothetical protein
LLSTTLPHGGARTQKNEDGVAALEKASRLDPENEDAREYLPRAKGMASQNLAAKKSSGCFVATAACGDPSAREVIVLSAFRDDVLLRSRVGRTFVRFYYVVSPPIAAVVARSALLRRSAMLLVIRPAVCLVKRVPK